MTNMQQESQRLMKKSTDGISKFVKQMQQDFGFKTTQTTQWGITVTKGEAFLTFKQGVLITEFTVYPVQAGGICFNMYGKGPHGAQPMMTCNHVSQLDSVVAWLKQQVL